MLSFEDLDNIEDEEMLKKMKMIFLAANRYSGITNFMNYLNIGLDKKYNLEDKTPKERAKYLDGLSGDQLIKDTIEWAETPFLIITTNRLSCKLEVSNCCKTEVESYIPLVIGHLLAILPDDKRNDVLVKAINLAKEKDYSEEFGKSQ